MGENSAVVGEDGSESQTEDLSFSWWKAGAAITEVPNLGFSSQ